MTGGYKRTENVPAGHTKLRYLEVPRCSYYMEVERLNDEMDGWKNQAGIGLCTYIYV
jgi:hypothetical protein